MHVSALFQVVVDGDEELGFRLCSLSSLLCIVDASRAMSNMIPDDGSSETEVVKGQLC